MRQRSMKDYWFYFVLAIYFWALYLLWNFINKPNCTSLEKNLNFPLTAGINCRKLLGYSWDSLTTSLIFGFLCSLSLCKNCACSQFISSGVSGRYCFLKVIHQFWVLKTFDLLFYRVLGVEGGVWWKHSYIPECS